MKIIKKNICLIVILSGVVGLSACSRDDALTSADDAEDNGNTIRFTTVIARFTGNDADPATRATINDEDGTGSFADGDEIMIMGFVFEAMPTVKKESPATHNSETWTTTMTWDEFYEGAHVAFSAFFPKRSLGDFAGGSMVINLPTDQSTTEQYAAYDWLHAPPHGKPQLVRHSRLIEASGCGCRYGRDKEHGGQRSCIQWRQRDAGWE